MVNVGASLSLYGTFSDIFDREKFAHLAELTACVKFHTSDDLSVESSKKAASCYLFINRDQLTTFRRISNFFHESSDFPSAQYIQGWGFPLAIMSVTSDYIHRKQKVNETKRTPWLFISPPTDCKHLASYGCTIGEEVSIFVLIAGFFV